MLGMEVKGFMWKYQLKKQGWVKSLKGENKGKEILVNTYAEWGDERREMGWVWEAEQEGSVTNWTEGRDFLWEVVAPEEWVTELRGSAGGGQGAGRGVWRTAKINPAVEVEATLQQTEEWMKRDY